MADICFRIIEAVLMARPYKTREEVLSAAELAASVACSAGNLTPAWVKGYKEAVQKMNTLSFNEMQEIISILSGMEDEEDETTEESARPKGNAEIPAELLDFGDDLYQQGMEFYQQNEYQQAAACFRAAAARGNGKAVYNYALCLYTGSGVPVNRTEAIKRLASASDCGIRQADQLLHYIAEGQTPPGV